MEAETAATAVADKAATVEANSLTVEEEVVDNGKDPSPKSDLT